MCCQNKLCWFTGSSDGSISILTYTPETNNWDAKKIQNAHAIGCNSVSWAPAITPFFNGNENEPQPLVKRLVSGGCDNLVKIWREDGDQWIEETKLEVSVISELNENKIQFTGTF